MAKNQFKINEQLRWYLLDCAILLEDGRKVKGWRPFTSTYRELSAYYNKNLGVVVKIPAIILEPRTPLSVRVPTVKLDENWIAQPLVRKTEIKKALTSLRRKLKPYLAVGIFPDIHRGNVGWYGNKPLMFDW